VRFFLGTHRPHHLGLTDVPLFVSHRTLGRLKRKLPVALGPWALDSGGFSELSLHGHWKTTPAEYVEAVERYRERVGRLVWAAPQDYMCEPFMVEKTGLSVREHQERTVENLLELRALAPHLPIVPVLQGWTLDEYHACVDLYASAGVNLAREPVVGLGSVCRRQHTDEAARIVRSLAGRDLRLHGFGFKTLGLLKVQSHLVSSDSLSWSFTARVEQTRLEGCEHRGYCANCLRYALGWRSRLLERLAEPRHEQMELI
jgi:hypothetical protein